MADYCRHAFGAGGDAMLGYFQRVEKAMVDGDRCLSYGLESPQRWGPKVFTEEVMKDAGALVERALAAAPAGACRQRVEFFRNGFEESRRALEGMRAKGSGKK
jgi:hypothetical protein